MAIKAKIIGGLLVLAGGAAALAYQGPLCSGWSGCYRLLTRIEDGRTGADENRHILMTHFAASSAAIAFSVPVSERSVGLVVVDRRSSTHRLIAESGFHFGNPFLSPDGQRLVIVRSSFDRPQRQLLSCQTATWRCTVLLQTENSVMSPVEINENAILLSSSPPIIRDDGSRRYLQYDLYLAEKGAAPVRLTDFKLVELGFLSAIDGKVVFGAHAVPNSGVLPKDRLDQTEIYSVDYDAQRLQIGPPSLPLTPLFQMSTLSIRPSVSANGRRIAFLNVEKVKGARYRYDLAVTSLDGNLQQRVELEGIAFSRGAFVGDTMIFNKLFKDHYRVRQLDLAQGSVADVLTIDHSHQAIGKLDRIELKIDGDGPETHAKR